MGNDEKKNKKWRKRLKRIVLVACAITCVSAGGFFTVWEIAPADRTCISCHEIRPSHETWSASSHRDVSCKACHGGTFSAGIHGLRQHLRRLASHLSEDYKRPEEMRLSEEQLVNMVQDCRKCHESAYAGWLSGGHSLTYADMLLNEKHNKTDKPNFDCLRCHGMFFEGTIKDIIERDAESKAGWRMASEKQGLMPAIPCLACHQGHTPGAPATRPDYSEPALIDSKRATSTAQLALYLRSEKTHLGVSWLPQITVSHNDRKVQVSPDPRQRLCVQCHAPEAFHRSGTSDDRTPRGVHEGLSCLACHKPHSHNTRASCAQCHPQLSNCGLNVEEMDTTFKSPKSKNNIHFVECDDCHPGGEMKNRTGRVTLLEE